MNATLPNQRYNLRFSGAHRSRWIPGPLVRTETNVAIGDYVIASIAMFAELEESP